MHAFRWPAVDFWESANTAQTARRKEESEPSSGTSVTGELFRRSLVDVVRLVRAVLLVTRPGMLSSVVVSWDA